ncbi:MAG: pro-sigmaK processing inhibitor BofA family protein [Candidatus Wallacebacter cryptica]|jgi:inhibitor of the pro-sigma K processing machinery|nr:pro-sigmaK processing inhibitor BofA [Bacillota bacterium]
MNVSIVFSYLLGLVILYFLARLMLIPLRVIARLLINGIIGGLLLATFNLAGSYFGLYLAINPITVLVAGLLGVPGVLLLAAIRYIVLG